MKSIFQTLAEWCGLSRNRLREPRCGYTEEQIRMVRDLRDAPGWEIYLNLLDAQVKFQSEVLLHSRDAAAIHEARGFILGLRKAVSIVDETLRIENANDDARNRLAADERDAADRRKYALYGTPLFTRS